MPNAEKLERTLREFGFVSLGLTARDFSKPDLIIQLGHEPNRIDLITQIDGVSFEKAWESRIQDKLEGIPVAFLSLQDLVTNKLATGREKDALDVKELSKLNPDLKV